MRGQGCNFILLITYFDGQLSISQPAIGVYIILHVPLDFILTMLFDRKAVVKEWPYAKDHRPGHLPLQSIPSYYFN